MERVKMVLYVQLPQVLYGCLRGAILFYKKMISDLELRGFDMNPYNPCVTNKKTNGNQFTIT